MSGTDRPHLIEADDGHLYVVKPASSSRARRTLVNEVLASAFFSALEILSPEISYVSVDSDFASTIEPDCSAGGRLVAGLHFGSRYPAPLRDPPVLDHPPKGRLSKIWNRDHFLGTLVLDRWTAHADVRQAIFFQAEVRLNSISQGVQWVAAMVDNGEILQGSDWTFTDSEVQGIYPWKEVYGADLRRSDFGPWLGRLESLQPSMIEELIAIMPRDWIAGQESQLSDLLKRLFARRDRTPQLVTQSVRVIQAAFRTHVSKAVGLCGVARIPLRPRLSVFQPAAPCTPLGRYNSLDTRPKNHLALPRGAFSPD